MIKLTSIKYVIEHIFPQYKSNFELITPNCLINLCYKSDCTFCKYKIMK